MRQLRINLKAVLGAVFLAFALFLIIPIQVKAEGSKDLVEDAADGTYRPFIEHFTDKKSAGVDRLQRLFLRVKVGETVCLGTSVQASDNGSEIVITRPNSTATGTIPVANLNVDGNTGFIANPTQEAAGPKYGATADAEEGYVPLTVTVTEDNIGDGIWTIEFISQRASGNADPDEVTIEADFIAAQGTHTIAAWDVSVFDESNQLKEGRLYANHLFFNIGNNFDGTGSGVSRVSVLDAFLYVYTQDQFLYKVDYNGMDPWGFFAYSNNRGFVTTPDNTSIRAHSLYHSLLCDNMGDNLFWEVVGENTPHNIWLNVNPSADAAGYDYLNPFFFNIPDQEFYPVTDTTIEETGITNFHFEGSESGNSSIEGAGGTFVFDADLSATSASSYQILLSFGETSTLKPVILSDVLVQGENRLYWDGKDATGTNVPAGTYTTTFLDLKKGEVHVPLLDVESNVNGYKLNRMERNNAGTLVPVDTNVYYDNVNDDPARFSDGWAGVCDWTYLAHGTGSATTGEDHSITPAPCPADETQRGVMWFRRTARGNNISSENPATARSTGDNAALDVWSYVSVPLNISCEYKIVTPSTIVAEKVLEGGNSLVPGAFEFNLYQYTPADPANNPYVVPTEGEGAPTLISTARNDAYGAIDFNPINFTNDQLVVGNTYYYYMEEVVPEPPISTIVYDTESKFVRIDIVQPTGATTGAVPQITFRTRSTTSGGTTTTTSDRIFTNTYTGTDTATIRASKRLLGRDTPLTAGEFSFALYPCDSMGNATSANPIETVTNDAFGVISFTDITYTGGDLPSLGASAHFYYYMEEVVPGGADLSIMAYDTERKMVHVTVNYSSTDGLSTTVEYPNGQTFTNVCGINVTLEATKTVTGNYGPLLGGDFSFELRDSGGRLLQTKSNDEQGIITFESLSFTSAGDYEYTLQELVPDEPNPELTYDTAIKNVTVHVTQSDAGLSATVDYHNDIGRVVFTNIHYVHTTATIDVLKNLKLENGSTLPANGSYRFTIKPVSFYPADANAARTDDATLASMPMPANKTLEIDGMGQGEYQGIIDDNTIFKSGTFDVLNFIGDGDGLPAGIYTYEITEVIDDSDPIAAAAKAEGITLDTVPCYVNVYVINQLDAEDVPTGRTYVGSISSWKGANTGAIAGDGGLQQDNNNRPAPDLSGDGTGKYDNDNFNQAETSETDENDGVIGTVFTNTYRNNSATITKAVAGSYADPTQEFPFDITVTLAEASTTALSFPVTTVAVDGTPTETNPLVIPAGGTEVKTTLNITHDQSIVISGLPANATVTVTEKNSDSTVQRGYKPSAIGGQGIEGADTTRYTDNGQVEADINADLTMSATIGDVNQTNPIDVRFDFTNERMYITPTGLVLYYMPYIISAVLVIAAGFLFFFLRKKKKSSYTGEGL